MRTLLLFAVAAVSLRADSYFPDRAGLGGEDHTRSRFTGWASDLNKPGAKPTGRQVTHFPGKDATKANIEAKSARARYATKADIPSWLVLIGHGTYDDLY